MADLDLAAIEASIAALTPEELRAQLTKIKTREKVTQKKYYNPEKAKALRVKNAALTKAMAEAAKKLGIYDEILAKATELADEKIAESDTGEDESEAA